MKTLVESQLLDGVIFGDNANREYVYVPASEIGITPPVCIFEKSQSTEDVSLEEALKLITRYSLEPVEHPRLGRSSC